MPYYMFYTTWNHAQLQTTMRDLAHNNVTSCQQKAATGLPRTCHQPHPDYGVITFRCACDPCDGTEVASKDNLGSGTSVL